MKYKIGDNINGFKLIDRWRKPRASGKGDSYGTFICKHCGEEFTSKVSHIVTHHTQSCGCSAGLHGKYLHPIYSVWGNMKTRCLNTNSPVYHHYGGRGISIYPPWVKDFMAFYEYVSQLPSYPGKEEIGMGKLSLDRIDNDGNYEPGNLRWATASIQNTNQRRRKLCIA